MVMVMSTGRAVDSWSARCDYVNQRVCRHQEPEQLIVIGVSSSNVHAPVGINSMPNHTVPETVVLVVSEWVLHQYRVTSMSRPDHQS
jgi:hypothetical protein